MVLDREKFLALALALAGCAKQGGSGVAEGYYPYDDPACTGFGYTDETELCVAWRGGKVKPGWVPTAECARWDDAGRCTANLFDRK
jgi:hypothetical protein